MSKWHDTILERYGAEWLVERSRKGGQAKVPKGFAKFDPEKRREAGRKGGTISRKRQYNSTYVVQAEEEADSKPT